MYSLPNPQLGHGCAWLQSFSWRVAALRSKNSKWVGLCTEINTGKCLERNSVSYVHAVSRFSLPDSLAMMLSIRVEKVAHTSLKTVRRHSQVIPVAKGGDADLERTRISDSFCWFRQSCMFPGCAFYRQPFSSHRKNEICKWSFNSESFRESNADIKKMKQLKDRKTTIITSKRLLSGGKQGWKKIRPSLFSQNVEVDHQFLVLVLGLTLFWGTGQKNLPSLDCKFQLCLVADGTCSHLNFNYFLICIFIIYHNTI